MSTALQKGLLKAFTWLRPLLFVGALCGFAVQALAQGLAPGQQLQLSNPASWETYYASEVSGEISLLNGRVSLGFSNTEGRNISDKSMVPRQLVSEAGEMEQPERHQEVGLDLEVFRSDPATLALAGIFVDDRSLTTKSNFELYQVNGFMHTRAADLGLTLGLFGERVRYTNSYSFSSISSQIDDTDEGSSGSKQWHMLDAELAKNDGLSVSAYGFYGTLDESFEGVEAWNFETKSESQDLAVGENIGFGAKIDFDFGTLTFSQSHTKSEDNGESRTKEIAGSVEYGFTSLTLSQEDAVQYGEGGSHETKYEGEFLVALDDLVSSLDSNTSTVFQTLLPSSFTLKAGRGYEEYFDTANDRPDVATSMGVSFYWDWGEAGTDISFLSTVLEIGNSDAVREDLSIDISQDFYGNDWDLSGYLSFFQTEESNAWADSGVSSGLDFTYYADGMPDISLSAGYEAYRGAALDYDYKMKEQNWMLGLSLDFGKFMPNFIEGDNPQLKINYDVAGTSDYDSDSGASAEWHHAFLVSGGFKF